jgi:hypothetical protein
VIDRLANISETGRIAPRNGRHCRLSIPVQTEMGIPRWLFNIAFLESQFENTIWISGHGGLARVSRNVSEFQSQTSAPALPALNNVAR